MHQQQNPLKLIISLQKAVTAFKAQRRRIRTMCTDEGDEHHMATGYSKHTRLKVLGIDNNHAAIEGMPVLSEEEAKMTTQAIPAMRGDAGDPCDACRR